MDSVPGQGTNSPYAMQCDQKKKKNPEPEVLSAVSPCPQVVEVNYAAHKHRGPRLIRTRGLMMLTPDYLTTNQSEECPPPDQGTGYTS